MSDKKEEEKVRVACSSEDTHLFNSTGQCSICGAHRRPAFTDPVAKRQTHKP